VGVEGWLRGLGLERYAQAFRDAEVTPEILVERVVEACCERFAVRIEEVRLAEETIYFKPPPTPLRKAS